MHNGYLYRSITNGSHGSWHDEYFEIVTLKSNRDSINAISETTLLGTVTSGSGTSLSESISNYRFVVVEAGVEGGIVKGVRVIPVSLISLGGSNQQFAISEAFVGTNYDYFCTFGFGSDGASVSIFGWAVSGWSNLQLKIYGMGKK